MRAPAAARLAQRRAARAGRLAVRRAASRPLILIAALALPAWLVFAVLRVITGVCRDVRPARHRHPDHHPARTDGADVAGVHALVVVAAIWVGWWPSRAACLAYRSGASGRRIRGVKPGGAGALLDDRRDAWAVRGRSLGRRSSRTRSAAWSRRPSRRCASTPSRWPRATPRPVQPRIGARVRARRGRQAQLSVLDWPPNQCARRLPSSTCLSSITQSLVVAVAGYAARDNSRAR